MMWSEKHRPKIVQEMIGNEDGRIASLRWLGGWVSGSRPLLLVGPPGTGKTTLVHALARQFEYDLVEMNASDTRGKDSLRERITPILHNTRNLLGQKIMLFLDEVDGISGREDTGGLDTLIGLMKEPTVPVVMAANEKSAKIKNLTKACKVIEFHPVPPRLLMLFLENVLQIEREKLSPGDKISIVNNSRGDVRSMLNSAQSRVSGYATASNRDIVSINISSAIDGYFSSQTLDQARKFISSADASYPDPRHGASIEDRRRDMLSALFSSIVSSGIEHEDLRVLLDVLSRVDMLVGRANADRNWHLLKYVSSALAFGLYEKSRLKGIRYSQYAMPWSVMGPLFARSQSTRKILGELAPVLHNSRSTTGTITLPYFIRAIIDEKLDPLEFAVHNFGDEAVGESMAREIGKVK